MIDQTTIMTTKIIRTCPSINILLGEMTDELQAHLDICQICQNTLAEYNEEDYKNMSSLKEIFLKKYNKSINPQPNEIWRINNSLAGWGENYSYYQPPLIYIKEVIDDIAICYQIGFHNTSNSINIKNVGYIQLWNKYSIKLKDLKHGYKLNNYIDTTEPKIFEDVDIDSWEYIYRNIELRVGSYFARKSIFK